MARIRALLALLAFMLVGSLGCGGVSDLLSLPGLSLPGIDAGAVPIGSSDGGASRDGATDGPQISAALVSIAITPPVASVAVGTKAVLVATANYADNTTKDISAEAAWTSDSPMLASVAAGLVTGVAPGTAVITATLNGVQGAAKITVPNAMIQSIAITPASATTGTQGTVAFHAVITLSDASTQDVTATATWSSSSPATASIAATGVATGLAAGTTTIKAGVAAVSAQATLTVTNATLVTLALTPTNSVAGIGVTIPFTATGTFSDGSVSDVSSGATWSSSTPSTASIDSATHAALTLAAGLTTITATVNGISGSTQLTVTSATLNSISITPASSTIAVNGTTSLTATGTYSDNTTADLTTSATWASDPTGVATVSNATGSQGVVTGLAGGTAAITATFSGITGQAAVTVSSAALLSISITPANPTVPKSTTSPLVAMGTYSDGTVIDVTTGASWSTDDATIASVSNATGSQGVVTGVSLGTTGAHATLTGITGSTTITVTNAVLVSITIAPANPTPIAGATQSMTATGVYSDNTTIDVTTSVVWRVGDSAVATVSNAAGSQGVLTAVGAGSTTLTATMNAVTGSTTVTVGPPTLQQIVVDPIASSVILGQNVTYTATAIYSNNTQQNVTGMVTWTSSDTSVATLGRMGGMGGPGGGGPGGAERAATVGAGTTTISATLMGVTGSTTLTVTSATLVQIAVTPIAPSLAVNATQQFTATAIYSDNTSQNVTGQATWQSSDTTVAQITTGGGGPGGGGPGGGARGNATALSAGTTTISTTFDGLTGSTTLTVTAATLTSISVNPAGISGGVGTQQQFTAQAIYSDNTSRDVTAAATWISSAPNVVGVSDAGGPGGGKGLAKALAQGTASISASFGGLTGSATFTVTSAVLTQIQITPFEPRVPAGFATQLTATAIYSDNTTRDVTALATWTSSATSTASVSNAGNSKGLLSPLSGGSATITATFQSVSGTDDVTVTDATLTSIAVTPATATLAAFSVQPFTALGTLSDNSTIDVTTYVTWLSSTPSIASISNAAGSKGAATALSSGTVTITAVRAAVSGTASLIVN